MKAKDLPPLARAFIWAVSAIAAVVVVDPIFGYGPNLTKHDAGLAAMAAGIAGYQERKNRPTLQA